jgi:hypothetical protein
MSKGARGLAPVCPNCGNEEKGSAACFLELPPDSRSDEITLFVKECPGCRHRYLAVYEESRRGGLGEDHWSFHGYECSSAAWDELKELVARCPSPDDSRCECATHRKLAVYDELGRWCGLDSFGGR